MHFYFQTHNFYLYLSQQLLQSQPWGLFFIIISYNSISLTHLLLKKQTPVCSQTTAVQEEIGNLWTDILHLWMLSIGKLNP